MESLIFDDERTVLLFNFLKSKGLESEFLPKKKKINFYKGNAEKLISLRVSSKIKLDVENKGVVIEGFSNYLLILIRSGLASVGLVQNGELLHHKVFRAYMVRKKQGKSQIKYLKTKGKSRAGSRIRLNETMDFLQDIGNRVNDHLKNYPVDQIGISCSDTLLPYFFNENEKLLLDKKDSRIFKIPKHIGSPTLETLLSVKEFIESNEIILMVDGKSLFQSFLEEKNMEQDEEDSEDW
jgi:hypothetical protein